MTLTQSAVDILPQTAHLICMLPIQLSGSDWFPTAEPTTSHINMDTNLKQQI